MVDNFGGFPAIGGLDGGVLSPVSNLDLGSAVSVTVVAIKSFSNGVISMFKGEIRVMDAETAEDLIENGLVATYAPVVPEVGENDKGKYLHTNEETGDKEWSNVPSELPTVGVSDKGKYLHTNAETGDKEWSNVPSELPTVGVSDKGKYLHTNAETGEKEWSNVPSGGGVLIVTRTAGTLDKTWQEIVDAMSTTGAVLAHYDDGSIDNLMTFQSASTDGESDYTVSTGSVITGTYVAASASGYPVQQTE